MRCYGQRICIFSRTLICRGLRERDVDEGLVRLMYGMDQGPHVDDKSWTKSKIKVETLYALEGKHLGSVL